MVDPVSPTDLLERALDEALRLMQASESDSHEPEVSIDLVMAMARVVDAMEQIASGSETVPTSSRLH
jgi:hypothetical protein